jgi:Co/Zn/Cd efflux system component
MDKKPKHLDPAYQTALIVCTMLNLVMLFVEGSAGLWIGSAALLADADDFLEDATVLGLAGHHRRCDHRNRKPGGLG